MRPDGLHAVMLPLLLQVSVFIVLDRHCGDVLPLASIDPATAQIRLPLRYGAHLEVHFEALPVDGFNGVIDCPHHIGHI